MSEQKNCRCLEELIGDFCKIILVHCDDIDLTEGENYINNLTGKERSILNSGDKKDGKEIVKNLVSNYLESYQIPKFYEQQRSCPFEFDIEDNYREYIENFKNYYSYQYENNKIPSILDFAFSYIKDISDHYKIFEKFYNIHGSQSVENIISEAVVTTQDDLQQTTKTVVENARKSMKQAEKNAKREMDKKIKEVNESVAKSSVTTLGIFSGIVLTVVGGMIYSSSVMANINTGNIYKLGMVSSLIGLVCINMLSIMFLYIERLHDGKLKEKLNFSKVNNRINIFLIIFMILCFILYQTVPDNGLKIQTEETTVEVTTDITNEKDLKESL